MLTPVAVVPYDLAVCTCMTQQGYFASYALLRWVTQPVFVKTTQQQCSCLYFLFALSSEPKISCNVRIQDTLLSFVLRARGGTWENHANSSPFSCVSSWDPEMRAYSSTHESCPVGDAWWGFRAKDTDYWKLGENLSVATVELISLLLWAITAVQTAYLHIVQ